MCWPSSLGRILELLSEVKKKLHPRPQGWHQGLGASFFALCFSWSLSCVADGPSLNLSKCDCWWPQPSKRERTASFRRPNSTSRETGPGPPRSPDHSLLPLNIDLAPTAILRTAYFLFYLLISY